MALSKAEDATAEALMRAHVRYMASDMERWMEILSDDILFEFPFGEAVGANPLRGKAAIQEAIDGFVGALDGLSFGEPTVYLLSDPAQAFGEFTGSATVKANGARYEQRYLTQIRCENGKIVHIREFFDPTRITRAFQAEA